MSRRAERRRQGQEVRPPWTPFIRCTYPPGAPVTILAEVMYRNSRYQVGINELDGGITHLTIHDHERTVGHDWRDLQRIKNELCGPEREAVELYPAESRVVDTANEYHLWVAPAGVRLPLGFNSGRLVSEEAVTGKGRQRPFEVKPPDLLSREEIDRLTDERMKERA